MRNHTRPRDTVVVCCDTASISTLKERGFMPWRRVKFGDVVRQCKEKVDPETSGLTRYRRSFFCFCENLISNEVYKNQWIVRGGLPRRLAG